MCWEGNDLLQLGTAMVVAITSGVSLITAILLWRTQKVARDTATCFDRIDAVGFQRSAGVLASDQPVPRAVDNPQARAFVSRDAGCACASAYMKKSP